MLPVKNALIASLLLLIATQMALPAPPGASIIPVLEQQFGLNEGQVRGALGALLVFARSQLVSSDFNELIRGIPNAEQIIRDVKLSGTVTHPLDTIDDYEKALGNLGMAEPLASQFAPAVVDALARTGHYRERDILARVLR